MKELHRQLGKERALHELMQEIKVRSLSLVWLRDGAGLLPFWLIGCAGSVVGVVRCLVGLCNRADRGCG